MYAVRTWLKMKKDGLHKEETKTFFVDTVIWKLHVGQKSLFCFFRFFFPSRVDVFLFFFCFFIHV